jgi:hypothetical protein
MFNGFASPNYTQTPNEFFDKLLSEIDSLSELKVTLVIIRQTIGWHKKKASLSITRLMELTGMARHSVIDGVRAAEERGTIVKIDSATSAYELNVSSAENALEGSAEFAPIKETNINKEEKDICDSVESPPITAATLGTLLENANVFKAELAANILKDNPPKKERKPREKNPVIDAWHDEMGTWPNATQKKALQDITDVNLFRTCLVVWRMRGFSPTNAIGVLEWYKQGGPPKNGKQKDPPREMRYGES